MNQLSEATTDHHKPANDPTDGRTVLIKVPASTANLGPGFDSLGLALELYSWFEMSAAPQTKFNLYGEQTAGLPVDKSNLVYMVAQQVFARVGVAIPEMEISIYSDIPLTRGLGSSAAAIVGALMAANELIGGPLTSDELFQMASSIEKHPDNVGASLFGGLVVAFWDGLQAEYIRVELDSRLETVVAIPDFQLSTEKARKVIPQTLNLKDAVYNIGHSNLLVAALCTGRYAMIRLAMKDVIHQPYRAALIPGMLEVLAGAAEHGALGAALSGAGPTLIALVDSEEGNKEQLEHFLADTLLAAGTEATLLWLMPSREGAQLLTCSGDHNTFMKVIGKEEQI
ncbi:MAG: homoserine kinase [Gorillibacterium sp.]|nr:homoserine kinase [Gorillibacterium sp.]